MSYNQESVRPCQTPREHGGLELLSAALWAGTPRTFLLQDQVRTPELSWDRCLFPVPVSLPLGAHGTAVPPQCREEARPATLTGCPQSTDTRCANHKKF